MAGRLDDTDSGENFGPDLPVLFKMHKNWSVNSQENYYKSSAVAEMGDHGHSRHGLKRGGAAVPLSRRSGTPSNTMWPGPRSTSVPSGIFIRPAVWPQ